VLAASVEPFALSALKYALLALLFLFIWRAMRWVVRGLNVDRTPAASGGGGRTSVATTPARQTILLVQPDGSKAYPYRLEGTTTLGRAAECELRLDDTYVSQQHARIFDRAGNWYVEDLGSTNGTFVNEQKLVAPAMLTPGDTVRVGTTKVELRR
jgi:pSer/pThr/pTyr-binding forkhead associated (FHA) protein